MHLNHLIIFCSLVAIFLLWLGQYHKLPKKLAACIVGVLFFLNGSLLLLAVLPGNSFYGEVITHGVPASKKRIALTFDDGPYPPYTEALLAVLQKQNVHATFFLVGENAAKHPALVTRLQAEGHEIALHAQKHQDLLKLSTAELTQNIEEGKHTLEGITGAKVSYMRPPHGFKDWAVVNAIHGAGLRIVNWNVIPRDWTNPGAKQIAKRVLESASDGAIVLLHDGDSPAGQASRAQTVAATELIIEELRKQGYTLVTVNEILK